MPSFGEMAALAAVDALTVDGQPAIFGAFWRRDAARVFQACDEAIDLSEIHTTCAVFASACWYWGGRRPLRHSRKSCIGSGIVGDREWLQCGAEYFVLNDGRAVPEVGDLPLFGPSLSLVHHVEIAVEVTADGLVRTAHGGGSPSYADLVAAGIQNDPDRIKRANGTVAALGTEPRRLAGCCGWMSAAKCAAAEGIVPA